MGCTFKALQGLEGLIALILETCAACRGILKYLVQYRRGFSRAMFGNQYLGEQDLCIK
jgi:hypothetical protein